MYLSIYIDICLYTYINIHICKYIHIHIDIYIYNINATHALQAHILRSTSNEECKNKHT